MSATESVPYHYLGVWQRQYLESPSGVDTSSHVFWLQTAVLHADIRVPADRPIFKNRQSLSDYTLEELKQLANQQGFAGITQVTGDNCQWQHLIDYQPPKNGRDIGHMQFNGNHILETGIDFNYAEIWERLPDSQGSAIGLRFTEINIDKSPGLQQSGILVISGDYFIFARDRSAALPHVYSLATYIHDADLNKQQIIPLLDFEVSFGRVAHGNTPWEIQLSTLPFREGASLFTETVWTAVSTAQQEFIQHDQTWNGRITRLWQV